MEHILDVNPIPKDQTPLFINEPWLIDESIYIESMEQAQNAKEPEREVDNRRIYIPLDLNKKAFLRRLEHIIDKYGDVTWRNESNITRDIDKIISQIEIYDKIWFVREGEYPVNDQGLITGHSKHAKEVIAAIITRLEQIDSCEDFSYMMIDELKKEYFPGE